ncbi:antitoxin [Salmonella enterica subsp. enterica]|nr:antitoxin [Salmonella enterica subsp. enterica]
MIYAKLRQQGGGVVVTIPAQILAAQGWKAGDPLGFASDGSDVRLIPAKRAPRGRRTVAQLVAGINPQDVAEWRASIEDDLTSDPIGKEII